jgi:hypothetical protein
MSFVGVRLNVQLPRLCLAHLIRTANDVYLMQRACHKFAGFGRILLKCNRIMQLQKVFSKSDKSHLAIAARQFEIRV